MITKTKRKLFWITDFESVEPADMVYRLDFKEGNRSDEASYQQIYQDYGWQYVATCNNFSIFRKALSTDQEDQIYSDRDSQYQMVKLIFRRCYLLVLGIYLLVLATMIGREPSFVFGFSTVLVPLLMYLGWRFYQLKKLLKGIVK
ncbi:MULTISPECIES: DUF2812 domain-containing protein [unclassified Streptococcus]|uniref:DUF2812 domain-containing protein n=1 Tax=unclassified Streptococcus TaxID=2608887 RepID=UPI00066FE9C8|nr:MULTISPECIES: DUF2812 domain-containing protein [unclassified Streptococcus]